MKLLYRYIQCSSIYILLNEIIAATTPIDAAVVTACALHLLAICIQRPQVATIDITQRARFIWYSAL